MIIPVCPNSLKMGYYLLSLYHTCVLTSHWSNLSIASPNLSCELLTDKMILLTKCFSAIWFLTIWTTWENSDFVWESRLSSLFSKINRSYNRHDVSATIWDQKFLLKSDLYGSDRLYLDIKMKVSPMASTWWTRFWPTIYTHQMMTLKLNLSYN